MSYSEQFFGVKENKILQYVNDLAWFGTNSSTYHDDDAMREILNDKIVGFSNPVANFYIYKYAKVNGIIESCFEYGFPVAVYNHNYKCLLMFRLLDFPADATQYYCKWVSMDGFVLNPSYYNNTTLGSDVLNMEDYTSIQFLNGTKKNWYNEWSEFNSDYDDTGYDAVILKKMPPLYSGFSSEVRSMLTPIKSGIGANANKNIYIGIPSYDDAYHILERLYYKDQEVPQKNPFNVIKFNLKHLDYFASLYSELVDYYLPNDTNALTRANEYKVYPIITRPFRIGVMTELTSVRTDLSYTDKNGVYYESSLVRSSVSTHSLVKYSELKAGYVPGVPVEFSRAGLFDTDVCMLPTIYM